MLSLYEILKASKTGIAPDMWTALAGMNWGGADSGHKVKELTGIPPLSFTADGTPLLDYLISGNTVQNGTPTPSNPVEVNGVGVRTENLFNATWESGSIGNAGGNLNDTNAIRTVGFIACEAKKLYSFSPELEVTETWVNYYDNNGGLSRYRITGGTFTTPQGCTRLRFRLSKTDIGVSPVPQPLSMLNVGAPLPYEPYGYKIPISNGQQTTNIYLGSTQTVRQVKKLVLTGEESWSYLEGSVMPFRVRLTENMQLPTRTDIFWICSHFTSISHDVAAESGNQMSQFICWHPNDKQGYLRFRDIGVETVAAFQQWVAAQYATGTPVTVWYVLATAETAAVNEPLMKIGDYADTVSMEQAGVQIPTLHGNTVIDVLTELKPSQMYIKYQE